MLKERFIERKAHKGFALFKAIITQRGEAFLAELSGAECREEKQTSLKEA